MMSKKILEKFHTECTQCIQLGLSTQLSSTAVSEHYFNEYQRCLNEEKHLVDYFQEQLKILEDFKSCETSLDVFLERLMAVHQYERRQNEIFEQILRQLTKAVRKFFVFISNKSIESFRKR